MGPYAMLGTRVDALTIEDLHARIADTVRQGSRRIFASHNLHSLYLHRNDTKLQRFYERADYIRIDGMAVVLLGRLLGLPLGRRHRVTYVDWLPRFMAEAVRERWRVFYLGSKPTVAERGAVLLRLQYPGLEISTAHGYFDPSRGSTESGRIIEAINAFRPHVLMVGMGMPLQQYWVLDHYDELSANVISTSGAALDYLTGEIPTPPRWAGQIGGEWLFRLAAEPRRLAGRYLIEPWFVLASVIRELALRRRSRRKRRVD
jgi:N-acetylglucosaminyldiphosphoundecaprenol N-acetyl-beta-D-mannosaminyltransferase